MADFFNNNIKGLSKFNKIQKETIKLAKENLRINKKLVKSFDFKDVKDIKKIDDEIKKLTETEKDLLKIKKQEEVSSKKLSQLKRKELDETIRLRTAVQSETKAIKDRIKASKSLTPQYDKERKKLAALQNKLTETVLVTGKSSVATRKLSKEVQRLNNRISGAEQIGGRFQRQIGKYPKLLSSTALAFGGAFLGVQGFVRVLGDAVNRVKDFESSNSTLEAVLGATDEQMSTLRATALQLGATTAFSASQVTMLETEFAKLGFPTQDIINMTASTLDAAAAMGSDLAATAKLTGATLKSFGLDSSEAARVNDVLARATSASALDFEKLSSSMSTIAPVAKKFGFSLEDTVSLLGELSNAGFDASSAATATRKILLNLADSNGKLAKSLKEPVKDLPSLIRGLKQLKEEGTDLGKALELTDVKSVAAFATFIEGTDSVLKLSDALEHAGGTAQRMADTQLDNLAGDIKIVDSAWEGFVLNLLAGEGVFSDLSRGFVQLGIKILGMLTPLNKLKKTQSELNDENIETLKTSRKNIKSNEKLANRYEELAGKTELSKDEKRELNNVTLDLIAVFGKSVSSINAETGALEINIGVVRKKILADRILESESSKQLITEKVRLETQIQLAADAEKTLESLASTFKASFGVAENEIVRLIESAKKGNLEYTKTLAEIKLGYEETMGDASIFNAFLESIKDELFETSVAVLSLGRNQEELNKINKNFLALGIDIDKFLEDEISLLIENTGATGGNSKARRELTGLIELQAKAVKDLQDQKDREKSEAEISRLTKEIESAKEELKRLKDLGDDSERLKREEQFLKSADELRIFREERSVSFADEEVIRERKKLDQILRNEELKGDERIDLIVSQNDEIEEDLLFRLDREVALERKSLEIALKDKKLNINEIKLLEEESAESIRQLRNKTSDQITDLNEKETLDLKVSLEKQLGFWEEHGQRINNLFREAFNSFEKEANNRIKKAEEERDKTSNAVDTQNKRFQDGLSNTLKFEEEQLALREKRIIEEQKRLERIKKLETIFNIANANISALKDGEPASKALLQTASDIAKLEALTALIGFIDGSDHVAKDLNKTFSTGVDDYVVRVDGREKILNPDHARRVGYNVTNEELVSVFEDFKNGRMSGGNFQEVKNRAKENRINDLLSSTTIQMTGIDYGLSKEINNLSNKIAKIEGQKIDVRKYGKDFIEVRETLTTGNKKIRNIHLIPRNG